MAIADDLAQGRVVGKDLGRRNVSGDLTGLARVKFDVPGQRPQRSGSCTDSSTRPPARSWQSGHASNTSSTGWRPAASRSNTADERRDPSTYGTRELCRADGAAFLPSRQQREGVDVLGSHDGEVAAVDGGELAYAQSLGCGDDRCIDGAKRKVAVACNELGDA